MLASYRWGFETLGVAMTNELKVIDGALPLSASDEVRAKLAECQLTDKDIADAVDWARAQAPTNGVHSLFANNE
jgi:hypothetical protein